MVAAVHASDKNTADQQKVSRKAAKMCTIVVSSFVITWTPFHTDRLYFAFGSNKALAMSLVVPALAMADANSCINPIIYGFMWKPMKDTILQV